MGVVTEETGAEALPTIVRVPAGVLADPWSRPFVEWTREEMPTRPPPHTRGRRLTMLLGGLYCSRCPGIIRGRLGRVRGVLWVAVSPYLHASYATAVVLYDPEVVHASDVVTAVGSPYTVWVVEDVALAPQPRHELVAGIA